MTTQAGLLEQGHERQAAGAASPAARRGALYTVFARIAGVFLILAPGIILVGWVTGNEILKRMKRRHSRADVIAVANRARAARDDVALTADLIAGFPTESDDAFAQTLALVDEIGLADAHVFPYSPRDNTPAARMPQLDGETIRRRAAALRHAVAASRARDLDRRIGATAHVLVEASRRDGLDARGTRVRLDREMMRGQIVPARILGHDGRQLRAVA